MLAFVMTVSLIVALIFYLVKKAPQEEVEKLPAQLAGTGIKIAAIVIAAVLSIAPTKDFAMKMGDLEDRRPASWMFEYYDEYEDYFSDSISDRYSYDEMQKVVIMVYIFKEFKILILYFILSGLGTLIQKRALANFELEKIRKAMSEKDNNYNTATTGNAASKPPAFCSDCGSKLSDKFTFCPGCGKQCAAKAAAETKPRIPVSEPKPRTNLAGEWVCKDCGTANPKTAVMCKGCGKYK